MDTDEVSSIGKSSVLAPGSGFGLCRQKNEGKWEKEKSDLDEGEARPPLLSSSDFSFPFGTQSRARSRDRDS